MHSPNTAPAPARSSATTIGITAYGCGSAERSLIDAVSERLGVAVGIVEAPPGAHNASLASGTRFVSVGHRTPITAPILLALREAGVEYVSTRSVGVDHIDVRYAERLGMTVENVAYSPNSVADFTLMLMLMAIRRAPGTLARAASHDYRLPEVPGRELRDLTVGVIGTGAIGSAVIERLRGFGCRILAHDRRPIPGSTNVPIDALLAASDIVTLHTPLTAETQHLLDREGLALMRRDAVVVNTGRGALIDTAALVEALEGDRLGGAALDVIEGEDDTYGIDHGDRPPDHALLLRLHALPNVIISPHTAYFTDHSLSDAVERSLRNCRRFERTHPHG